MLGGRLDVTHSDAYAAGEEARPSSSYVRERPFLYIGGLSDRVFLATRYTRHRDGAFEVLEEFDITDQFVDVALTLDEDWWNAKSDEDWWDK
jgi:hypothetical protein